MWIKYFTITPIVGDLVCTGEGEKCISSALKTKGKLWHRPPCQEFTVHAQAPSVDCTECRATSSDFSELPGTDISGTHDDKKNVFLLFFLNVRTQDRAILKTKSSWMCKDWWQCYHYIFEIYSMLRKDRKSMYWGVAPCCADIIFFPKIKNLEDVFGVQQPLLSTRTQQGATISPVLPKGLVLNMFVFLCTLQRLLQIHQKGPFCVNRWSSP